MQFADEEERIGYLFGKPDTVGKLWPYGHIVAADIDPATGLIKPDSDHAKAWGEIVTVDEMRQVYMFGNSQLMSWNGSYITDSVLRGWIDECTLAISEELQHDFLPKLRRHRPINHLQRRTIEDYAEWEDPYDYKTNQGPKDFFQVVLRYKPVIQLIYWGMYNPFSDSKILELTHRAKVTNATGLIRSVAASPAGMVPNAGVTVAEYRMYGRGVNPAISVPYSFFVDYTSGYDSAGRVPAEIRELVGKLVAIKVMTAFGDGKNSGLAANIAFNSGVISQSVSLKDSGSGVFAATIKQYQDWIQAWRERSVLKYAGIRVGGLGR